MKQQLEEREARLAAKREALALQELDGCTFAPEIHGRPASSGEVVEAPGLEDYYKRVERAKRMEEQHRARCAKVFNENPQARKGATEAVAPALKSAARAEAKARPGVWDNRRGVIESLQRRIDEELTFKPKTNYSSRRSLVDRIMKEHSERKSRAASSISASSVVSADENLVAE